MLGLVDGLVLGDVEGEPLGLPLGEPDGEPLGLPLGEPLGEPDGEPLGLLLGLLEAEPLGDVVGLGFGCVEHMLKPGNAGVGAFWLPQPMLNSPHFSEA